MALTDRHRTVYVQAMSEETPHAHPDPVRATPQESGAQNVVNFMQGRVQGSWGQAAAVIVAVASAVWWLSTTMRSSNDALLARIDSVSDNVAAIQLDLSMTVAKHETRLNWIERMLGASADVRMTAPEGP